jgi:hypothetical protein
MSQPDAPATTAPITESPARMTPCTAMSLPGAPVMTAPVPPAPSSEQEDAAEEANDAAELALLEEAVRAAQARLDEAIRGRAAALFAVAAKEDEDEESFSSSVEEDDSFDERAAALDDSVEEPADKARRLSLCDDLRNAKEQVRAAYRENLPGAHRAHKYDIYQFRKQLAPMLDAVAQARSARDATKRERDDGDATPGPDAKKPRLD